MKNLKSLMTGALVAFAMFASAGQAVASQVYHVAIDSRGLSGQGYLDFLFLGLGSAATADVQLTHFTGDFVKSTYTMSNAEGSLDMRVTIHNDAGWNEFAQLANLGGLFGFDVQFSVANDGTAGTNLSLALLDPSLNAYVGGTTGDLVTFALYPGEPASLTVSDRAAAGPAAVPEPATLAGMASGLMLMFATLRRRRL